MKPKAIEKCSGIVCLMYLMIPFHIPSPTDDLYFIEWPATAQRFS